MLWKICEISFWILWTQIEPSKDHYANALSVVEQVKAYEVVKNGLQGCLEAAGDNEEIASQCYGSVFGDDYFWLK